MSFRKLLRSFTFASLTLFLTASLLPGFEISSGLNNLLFATLALTALNVLVKPIVKLLLLPINLITLGAFRWLATVIILYALTWVVPTVNIFPFPLHQTPIIGIFLPKIIVGKFLATLITAFFFTIIHRTLYWLTKS